MKKLIMIVCILLFAGCNGHISTWAFTSQDTDVKALIGYNDGWEAGVIGVWHPVDDVDWGPEPTGIGAYIGADTTWLISASDEPDKAPPPFSWLDGLHAVPYGRIEWLDSVDNDKVSNLQPQFVAGTRFLLDEQGLVAIAVQYSDGDQSSGNVFIGANIRF